MNHTHAYKIVEPLSQDKSELGQKIQLLEFELQYACRDYFVKRSDVYCEQGDYFLETDNGDIYIGKNKKQAIHWLKFGSYE